MIHWKKLFKKNAVAHKLQWERSLGLEAAGLGIFIQPHDVTQDSKEHQNAKVPTQEGCTRESE